MANTTNLNLEKPLDTDQALISVINSNSDKIDAFAGSTNQALAKDVFALKTGTDIPRSTDFNALITPGNYRVRSYSDAASMTNIPQTTAGTLYVKNGMLESGANFIQQIYVTFNDSIYIRYSENKGSSWYTWDQLALKNDINNISNKLYMTGSATSVSTATDFNTLTNIGNYRFNQNTVVTGSANRPCDSAGRLCVASIDGTEFNRTWVYGWQIYTDITGREFRRTMSTGSTTTISFGGWKEVAMNSI